MFSKYPLSVIFFLRDELLLVWWVCGLVTVAKTVWQEKGKMVAAAKPTITTSAANNGRDVSRYLFFFSSPTTFRFFFRSSHSLIHAFIPSWNIGYQVKSQKEPKIRI